MCKPKQVGICRSIVLWSVVNCAVATCVSCQETKLSTSQVDVHIETSKKSRSNFPSWSERYGLDETAPNDTLLSWLSLAITRDAEVSLEEVATRLECIIPDKDIAKKVEQKENLKWLRIAAKGGQKKKEKVDLSFLNSTPELQGLLVDNVTLTNASMQEISRLEHLRWLCMFRSRLPSQAQEWHFPPSIEVLCINHTELPDNFTNGVRLPVCLRTLNVSGTGIDDSSISKLPVECQTISSLEMFHCKAITVQCFNDLSKLSDLRYLGLVATDFGDQFSLMRDRFDKEFPDCHVVFLD